MVFLKTITHEEARRDWVSAGAPHLCFRSCTSPERTIVCVKCWRQIGPKNGLC